MSAPFQPGDVVVCVDAAPRLRHLPQQRRDCAFIRHGGIYRVRALDLVPDDAGETGLHLEGIITWAERYYGWGWAESRFRKIDDEVTDEFRQALKCLKSPTPETADA